jgi:two-component system response regulator DesR
MPEGDPRKTRILCVDDDQVTNRIHSIVLGGQPDMDVVGSASRREEVLAAIERSRPDVVLLDYMLRDAPCDDVLRAISASHPGVRVIILSGLEREDLPPELAGFGAAGFVTKGSDLAAFLEEIRRAIRDCDPLGSPPLSA